MSSLESAHSEYRTLLLADIESYARGRDDAVRSRLRARLRQLLSIAFAEAQITSNQTCAQSTGDGLLVTIDPTVGKPRILGGVIESLAAGLREQNRRAIQREQLRIRMVLHAADLLIDSDGPLGDQVNFAFRLLDAQRLRDLLKSASGPMLVCVSEVIYRQVIAQRHEGLEPTDFEPVRLESKGTRVIAWVRAPGEPGLVARSGLSTADGGDARNNERPPRPAPVSSACARNDV